MMNRRLFKVQGSTLQVARPRLRGGFTLIEVLVAMSIFAIAVLGLAVGSTTVMRANQTSLYTTIATNLAQDRLEELKSRTAANINTTGSPENNIPVSGVPVQFTRSWTVTANCNSVTGLTCIDVTVSWTDYTSHTLTISSAVKQ
jgi:type II secretion system protein I